MKFDQAIAIANQLVEYLRDGCERIEIAGSLRRRRPDVKDIELVVIPKVEKRVDPFSLLGDTFDENLLHTMVRNSEVIRWIKPGTSVIETWPIKDDGRYWRGLVREGCFGALADMKLDLFLARPENWGVIFCIRTGSDDFSRGLVTHAKYKTQFRVDGGNLTVNGEVIECREEARLFEALGLQWMDPQLRNGETDVHRLRSFNKH